MGSPNAIAYGALLAFVPIAIIVLGLMRPPVAAIALSLVGTLFLPERTEFDLPGLPALNKRTLVHLAILIGFLVQHPKLLSRAVPRRPVEYVPWLLLAVLLAGAFGTALTNQDSIPLAGTLTPYDGLSISIGDLLRYAIPFTIGWCLFRTRADLRLLLQTIVIIGAAYSLLTLWEGRMSPQLHRQLYGFHADEFHHVMRWGGYRPAVFMNNGLAVALHMAVVFAASIALLRARIKLFQAPPLLTVPYFGAVLVLCKSTAAIFYGAGLLPALLLLRARWLSLVAVGLACLVLAYPLTRWTGVFPTQMLTDFGFELAEKRGESLKFRFDNEDLLLARALERPAFGWGTKDRPAVYDPETGEKESTVDGYWILLFGYKGGVGWACVFGLLLLPIFRAAAAVPRIGRRDDQILLASLAVIVALYAVDMLPNGFFTNGSFFLTGSLFGLAGALPGASDAEKPSSPAPRPRRPVPEVPTPPPPDGGRMAGMR